MTAALSSSPSQASSRTQRRAETAAADRRRAKVVAGTTWEGGDLLTPFLLVGVLQTKAA